MQRRDIAARLIEHYVPLRRSGRQRTAINADDVGLRVCLRAELCDAAVDSHTACRDHRLRRAAGRNARLGNALLQPLLHGHHLKIQDSKQKNIG